MNKWMTRVATSAATMVLLAPMALADEGLLDKNQFKVDNMVGSGLGSFLAKILSNILFLVFEVAVVAAIGMIVWNLVLMMVGKKSREEIGKDLTNKLMAIFGIIIILTGGGAMIINLMTQTAAQTIDSAGKTITITPKGSGTTPAPTPTPTPTPTPAPTTTKTN